MSVHKIEDFIAHDDSRMVLNETIAPWNGKPVLVKWSAGWCEAWWCSEDWQWVALDDTLNFELDDVSHWAPLPEVEE